MTPAEHQAAAKAARETLKAAKVAMRAVVDRAFPVGTKITLRSMNGNTTWNYIVVLNKPVLGALSSDPDSIRVKNVDSYAITEIGAPFQLLGTPDVVLP